MHNSASPLTVLGRRWTLEVLLALAEGPRRFSGLRRQLPRLSASVLSLRLRELEAALMVKRGSLSPTESIPVYQLSEGVAPPVQLLRDIRAWADLAASGAQRDQRSGG